MYSSLAGERSSTASASRSRSRPASSPSISPSVRSAMPEPAWQSPGPSAVELLLGELPSLHLITQRRAGQRRVRAGRPVRNLHAGLGRDLGEGEQVVERLLGSAAGEVQAGAAEQHRAEPPAVRDRAGHLGRVELGLGRC